jgi:hypothetical protein
MASFLEREKGGWGGGGGLVKSCKKILGKRTCMPYDNEKDNSYGKKPPVFNEMILNTEKIKLKEKCFCLTDSKLLQNIYYFMNAINKKG